jgi:hypothetical protein
VGQTAARIALIRGGLPVKPFTTIAAALLSLIALLQLLRFALGWEVTVNGVTIPVWASGIAFIIAGALAVLLWRESNR